MELRIINRDELDYNKFEIVARLIELYSYGAIRTEIKVVYFDAGQNWFWTTIVAYRNSKDDSWQMLSPKNWKEIMGADTNELWDIAMEIVAKQSDLF